MQGVADGKQGVGIEMLGGKMGLWMEGHSLNGGFLS